MKRISPIFLSCVLLLSILLAQPRSNAKDPPVSVLERSEVGNFHVTEETTNRVKTLRVRGIAYEMCEPNGQTRLTDTNGDIFLEVPVKLVQEPNKKNFCFDVSLLAPGKEKKVFFGTKKKQVWPYDKEAEILTSQQLQTCRTAIRWLLKTFPASCVSDFTVDVISEKPNFTIVELVQWREKKIMQLEISNKSPYSTVLLSQKRL